MPEATGFTPGDRSLAAVLDERGPFPEGEALAVLRRLLAELRALHASGRTHRGISAAAVLITPEGAVSLSEPPAVLECGAEADPEACPPELHGLGPVRLPAGIDEARQALAQAGCDLDPRRIDVYQLGALLCRLLTGEPAAAYLRSPRVKARVPPSVRPLLERALGYHPADRFHTCEEFALALDSPGATAPPTPEPAPANGDIATKPPSPPPAPPAVATPAEEPSPPLDRLGHYRVIRRLGRGGMGEVYLAYEEGLRRHVAVKVLPPRLARDGEFVRRFHAEATAAASLQHPNVVPIYFTGQEGGHHFFAMKYVEGETLEARLARRGRLALAEARTILEHCLAGLGAAHAAGLVHRDVKPGNILLEEDLGRALVADFGLVKSGSGLTATGTVLGTMDYIAPEQARGEAVDGRADLYALGAVAYRMLSGRLPFEADTPTGMLFQHAYAAPHPFREAAPDVPAGLAAVVERLMAKDPADRYRTAADALADLRRFREEASVPTTVEDLVAPEAAPGSRQRRRIGVAVGLGLLVAVLGPAALFLGGAFTRPSAPPPPPPDEPARPACDSLRADAIPRWLLAYADAVSPRRAPPGLVAVLGHDRFRFPGEAGFPSYSPDGTLLAIPSGNLVLLYDAKTGEFRRALAGHGGLVHRLAFSPDGTTIASASLALGGQQDRTVRLWDVGTGRELPLAPRHTNPVLDVAFSPDGRTVAFASADGSVRLWDLASGKEGPVLPGHERGAWSIAFHPKDSATLATGSRDGKVRLWRDVTGRLSRVLGQAHLIAQTCGARAIPSAGSFLQIRVATSVAESDVFALPGKLELDEPRAALAVAFSPDGRFLAGGSDYALTVWEVASLGETFALKFLDPQGKPTPSNGVAGLLKFTADGKTILGVGHDQRDNNGVHTLGRWDAANGKELSRVFLVGRRGWARYCLSPDGTTLAGVGAEEERIVRVHDAQTGKPLFPEVAGHTRPIVGVAFSPDGRLVASASHDGTACLWDVATGRPAHTLPVSHWPVRGVAFSPDGKLLATAGDEPMLHGAAKLWYVSTGQHRRTLGEHAAPVECVAFSPDGKLLASAGRDGAVRLWDVGSGTEVPGPKQSDKPILALAFSPDGRRLAFGESDGRIHFWEMAGGTEARSWLHGSEVRALAYFPDGQTLASAGTDGTVRLWSANGVEQKMDLLGDLSALAVAPDGKTVASVGVSGAVCLWDTTVRPPRRQFTLLFPPGHRLGGVAFSPEGRHLATGNPDGSVYILRLSALGSSPVPGLDGAR
jgi:WD40 repeat protein/serine/threonine protein kinase